MLSWASQRLQIVKVKGPRAWRSSSRMLDKTLVPLQNSFYQTKCVSAAFRFFRYEMCLKSHFTFQKQKWCKTVKFWKRKKPQQCSEPSWVSLRSPNGFRPLSKRAEYAKVPRSPYQKICHKIFFFSLPPQAYKNRQSDTSLSTIWTRKG